MNRMDSWMISWGNSVVVAALDDSPSVYTGSDLFLVKELTRALFPTLVIPTTATVKGSSPVFFSFAHWLRHEKMESAPRASLMGDLDLGLLAGGCWPGRTGRKVEEDLKVKVAGFCERRFESHAWTPSLGQVSNVCD